MVEMEEDKFSFKPLKEISEYRLKQIWNSQFSDKPFQEVKASLVEEKEFIRFHKRLIKSSCTHDVNFTRDINKPKILIYQHYTNL